MFSTIQIYKVYHWNRFLALIETVSFCADLFFRHKRYRVEQEIAPDTHYDKA
jgi:hypothetical protein